MAGYGKNTQAGRSIEIIIGLIIKCLVKVLNFEGFGLKCPAAAEQMEATTCQPFKLLVGQSSW
jgi:hypothetical protein